MDDTSSASDTIIYQCDSACLAKLVKVHKLRSLQPQDAQIVKEGLSIDDVFLQLKDPPGSGMLFSDYYNDSVTDFFSLLFYQDMIQLFQNKKGKRIMTNYDASTQDVTQNGKARPADFSPKFLKKVESILGAPDTFACHPLLATDNANLAPAEPADIEAMEKNIAELEEKQQRLSREYCESIMKWVVDQDVEYAMLSNLKQSDEINFDNMTIRPNEIEWTYARDQKMAIFKFNSQTGNVTQNDEVLENPFIVTFQENLQSLLDKTSDKSATLYLANKGEGDAA